MPRPDENSYLLAIDQGTTSSRAIVFTDELEIVGMAQEEFPQHYPRSGWVEHVPDDIWKTVVRTARAALTAADIPAGKLAGVGITNQRETALLWDRKSGEPLHNALVWQDRRTSEHCRRLQSEGHEPLLREKTGLLLDPYFSATKLAWMLDTIPGARARAERGELAAGTVDTFLIWRLTGGRRHVTDATNASRTMLMDIGTGQWDDGLCSLFGVPRSLLPEILDSAADFGTSETEIFGAAVPILGVAGDQQAAAVGQACFEPGMLKSTYGTGCFALLNTGTEKVHSHNRLLTTIACQLAGERTYALEGSIFVAGAVVQWLRDGLHMIERAHEAQNLSEEADPGQDVVLVPAFTGLGAPYWDPRARGTIVGITRGTNRSHLARAALEAIAFQSADVLYAMQQDSAQPLTELRVDGGASENNLLMQFQADLLGVPVVRPTVTQTTAVGAAYLAGLGAGYWRSIEELGANWRVERRFEPQRSRDWAAMRLAGWAQAVARAAGDLERQG